MLAAYQQYCSNRQQTHLYRQLPLQTDANILDFASNDYLALSQSPLLHEAAKQTALEYGIGATGSRLLSGNSPLFSTLEIKIAQAKSTETALIMASGFQANSSVLGCLLNQEILQTRPLVFFDKLNHASLYQAIFLSQAELIRYRHNDMEHLNDLLEKFHQSKRPKFIVTETVFGMDGDIVAIEEIAQLARLHHTFLYLDEAHATGIFGPQGYGVSTMVTLTDIPHVIMGTFSKALGCFGAYIACSNLIKNYLLNKCAGFIYSTAPSPMLMGAALKAWELLPTLHQERQTLLAQANFLRKALQTLGFNTGASSTHIMPLILEKESTATEAQTMLLRHGIRTFAIRPPSVPAGASRLRIALNTQHTEKDIIRLINTLKNNESCCH